MWPVDYQSRGLEANGVTVMVLVPPSGPWAGPCVRTRGAGAEWGHTSSSRAPILVIGASLHPAL